MKMKTRNRNRYEKMIKGMQLLIVVLICMMLVSCNKTESNEIQEPVSEDKTEVTEDKKKTEKDDSETETVVTQKNPDVYTIEAVDEGTDIFFASVGFYQYGPSIMKYEDGSYDAWFSSPGNSGSEWDWISYRHSDNGIDWSEETIVLRPTPGTKDQCSVCDPGVIYFDGYYYLAYTGTDDYEGKGSNNSAFVARSVNPDGPFEKWNGSSWGGYPQPIIIYEGDPKGFGIGEVSFVILDEDLYIFYTYYDNQGGMISLSKADLVENWPGTIRYKGDVLLRENQDSLDVVYDERLERFFGFSIDLRMTKESRLVMYESKNGKDFTKVDSTKTNIADFAHNVGVSKSPAGHIDSDDGLLVGYAYGENWGRWNTKVQIVRIVQ